MRRVAIIGSGISGLSAAWQLTDPRQQTLHPCHVSLYEAADVLGGHTHTVDVTLPDAQGRAVTHGVDTGFLVFNHRTYPGLRQLFAQLQVQTAPSDMSFSVQFRGAQSASGRPSADTLEWSGSNLDTVFAQRSLLWRPRFWGMLRELLRFNRLTTALAQHGSAEQLDQTIGQFLDGEGFSEHFRQWYFLPMIGCIWSCPTEQMLQFPVSTMIRFCHNHGLLQVTDRPQWYTVAGGAREYVRRMVALQRLGQVRLGTPVHTVRPLPGGRVQIDSAAGSAVYDEVVLACHSDQSLRLLGPHASPAVRRVLGAIAYHPNRAVLHTDTGQLPQRRKAWAAWNYEHAGDVQRERSGVCLHYLINRLQPLPWTQPVIVSLNPVRPIAPEAVLGEFDYSHPVFDRAAMAAQHALPALQGQQHLWFCGAWTGYGFHEDGLQSGLAVAGALSQAWQTPEVQRWAA